MNREIRLLLVPVLLAACGRDAPPAPPAPASSRAASPRKEVVVPTTGISMIQERHEGLIEEIQDLEDAKARGEPVRDDAVRRLDEVLDSLITAAQMSVRIEAKNMAGARVQAMKKEFADFERRKTELHDEIMTIRKMIDGARKGVGELPEGYTESELLDLQGDREVELADLVKEMDAFRARLGEQEALAAQKEVPPQGETLFTTEMDALWKTKERLQALRQ
jgi:hypothetical protein